MEFVTILPFWFPPFCNKLGVKLILFLFFKNEITYLLQVMKSSNLLVMILNYHKFFKKNQNQNSSYVQISKYIRGAFIVICSKQFLICRKFLDTSIRHWLCLIWQEESPLFNHKMDENMPFYILQQIFLLCQSQIWTPLAF